MRGEVLHDDVESEVFSRGFAASLRTHQARIVPGIYHEVVAVHGPEFLTREGTLDGQGGPYEEGVGAFCTRVIGYDVF